MNETSSRSHCIVNMYVTKVKNNNNKLIITKSSIKFIDLAGSERVGKTGKEGTHAIKKEISGFEGVMINWDLFSLGLHFENTLKFTDKKKARIQSCSQFPSVLSTTMFDAIDGNTYLYAIICISPSSFNGTETKFTLEYAKKMSLIKIKPIKSKEYDCKK